MLEYVESEEELVCAELHHINEHFDKELCLNIRRHSKTKRRENGPRHFSHSKKTIARHKISYKSNTSVYHVINSHYKIEAFFDKSDIVPDHFIKGRGMRPYVNPDKSICHWFWPGEEPAGWTIGTLTSDYKRQRSSEIGKTTIYKAIDSDGHKKAVKRNMVSLNSARYECPVCGKDISVQASRKAHTSENCFARELEGLDFLTLDAYMTIAKESRHRAKKTFPSLSPSDKCVKNTLEVYYQANV